MSDRRSSAIGVSGHWGARPLMSRADLQLVAAAFLAGSGWLFSMRALEHLPPLLFMGSRFVLAGLLIAIFARFDVARQALRNNSWLLVSAGAMALSMTGWILALKHTSNAGVAAFISATGNLMVPLVGSVLFGWALPRILAVSLPLAALGLSFLFLDAGAMVDTTHLLFLGSALLWAVSVALVRNASPSLGTAAITGYQLVTAGAIMLAASFGFEDFPESLPNPVTWVWFAASVLFSTCLRFAFQYQGLRAAPPGRAAILLSFEPIWTMVLAFAVLGTSISWLQALGCATLFAAITTDLRSSHNMRVRQTSPPDSAREHLDMPDVSKER